MVHTIRERVSGDRGTRTPDLCVANASLSQLSYIPEKWKQWGSNP